MHGTYFFQNEVFEDEGAGEVRLQPYVVGGCNPMWRGCNPM